MKAIIVTLAAMFLIGNLYAQSTLNKATNELNESKTHGSSLHPVQQHFRRLIFRYYQPLSRSLDLLRLSNYKRLNDRTDSTIASLFT